jgi:hypothetical protein
MVILSLLFLAASHIISWSVREEIRLNLIYGICLPVQFDKGCTTVISDFRVHVLNEVNGDAKLKASLQSYHGKKYVFLK